MCKALVEIGTLTYSVSYVGRSHSGSSNFVSAPWVGAEVMLVGARDGAMEVARAAAEAEGATAVAMVEVDTNIVNGYRCILP